MSTIFRKRQDKLRQKMKHATIIIFVFISSISLGQVHQWFPAKYDSLTKKYITDTSGAFPVSFIKVKNGVVNMYGHHTHYTTEMKLIGNYYFSNRLTIRNSGDPLKEPYVNAKYYFYIGKRTSKLIIQRQNKTDTLIFIKSLRPFRDINGVWG